jgi:predicted dehydrogenase
VSAPRIGVIGYGYWGSNLVRNFSAGPRAKVVEIAEQSPHRRRAARAQYPDIKIIEDAAPVIADPDIDAVAIATPIFTHHELANRALQAGEQVLVEKTMRPSSSTCSHFRRCMETSPDIPQIPRLLKAIFRPIKGALQRNSIASDCAGS